MAGKSFKTPYRVVWSDTDAAQVVHYANYFRFFERAEEEFYRTLGFSFTDPERKGIWFPRVEAFCQYKKPARFNDVLEITLTIRELKEKSIKYVFTVFNEKSGDLIAEGHLVIVSADMASAKAVPIPPEFIEKLKPYIETA